MFPSKYAPIFNSFRSKTNFHNLISVISSLSILSTDSNAKIMKVNVLNIVLRKTEETL